MANTPHMVSKACQASVFCVTFRKVPFRYTMLTGAELLSRVKELGDCAKTDLARGCGYVVTKKDGSEQVKFTEFYLALLEAKGVSVGGSGAGIGKAGRKLSYKATVQGNGNLLIGKAYTAMLNLEPGDEFDIKLGKKAIRLIPTGSAATHSEGAEGVDDGGDATQDSTAEN